tara:strand:- start:6033 stop:7049 length:1017 start_codon:yes stop_codon:yes gene_type:complete
VILESERRLALRGSKLRALVAAAGGPDGDHEVDGDYLFDGTRLWVLAASEASEGVLGAAVLRAGSHEDSNRLLAISVCVDDPVVAATVARRAEALQSPPDVFSIDGGNLVPAQPAEAPVKAGEARISDGFDELCRGAGVEPLLEHGIWRGEVLGLEVVRVVDETDISVDGGPVVRVGVGRFDREAGALMHGGRSDSEALAAAADLVRAQRRVGAGAHPLATLARERWLRHDICVSPETVDLVDLVPVDPADERSSLRDPSPAPAIGTGLEGERVLVVCSVGVDPRLLGAACELVLRERPDRVLVVLPNRDVLTPVKRAMERLQVPALVVGATCGWEKV